MRSVLGVLVAMLLGTAASGEELAVRWTNPPVRSLAAPADQVVAIGFDRPVDPATVTSLSVWAVGRWSGAAGGTVTVSPDKRTVVLTPDLAFSAGERVLVLLSHDLAGEDGSPMRAGGFSFQFWTAARGATLAPFEVDRLTTRDPSGDPTRAYGGFAADLDEDGWLDLTIVNEMTDDLRVFVNRADGSGTFFPFSVPTQPTGRVPSPSETGDFDRDGHMDVAVANTVGSSVSILAGRGDGTFESPQEVALPSGPRGIAVLDADGDGDLDLAATQRSGSDFVLMLNHDGVFGTPVPFGSGSGTPWALGAADFDEDGLLDLAVGTRTGEQALIYRGNGDATFELGSTQWIGGAAWMMAVGDVNGDGHEDLSVSNSSSDSGAILLGDGTGGLAPPSPVTVDPFPIATDLGDLDGDGDLDWILASFQGDWTLLENDGSAGYTVVGEFPSTRAASCSLMFDIDSDGALDLALIDELEDEVIVLRNQPSLAFADGFESGDTSAWFLTQP